MDEIKAGTLQAPGASLYYKMRGAGPILLILQGGSGNADGSDALADRLVDSYSVVTYDRRGLSRSKLNETPDPLRLEVHADDAHCLLAELTNQPAFVFGSSLGALIGLDLVARYPHQVRTLIAHEPPARGLLSAGERANVERTDEEVQEALQREGAPGALKRILATSGVDFNDREPDVQLPQPSGAPSPAATQRMADLAFFFTNEYPAVRRYQLDNGLLQTNAARIVPAAGSSSRNAWPHHAAAALAAQLGAALVEFPGGHTGYLLRPKAFAARLREVFTSTGT
jgi:pimeloyl-ACP methyl ester carboxylesterase